MSGPITRQDINHLNEQVELLTRAVSLLQDAVGGVIRAMQEKHDANDHLPCPRDPSLPSPYDASVVRLPRSAR